MFTLNTRTSPRVEKSTPLLDPNLAQSDERVRNSSLMQRLFCKSGQKWSWLAIACISKSGQFLSWLAIASQDLPAPTAAPYVMLHQYSSAGYVIFSLCPHHIAKSYNSHYKSLQVTHITKATINQTLQLKFPENVAIYIKRLMYWSPLWMHIQTFMPAATATCRSAPTSLDVLSHHVQSYTWQAVISSWNKIFFPLFSPMFYLLCTQNFYLVVNCSQFCSRYVSRPVSSAILEPKLCETYLDCIFRSRLSVFLSPSVKFILTYHISRFAVNGWHANIMHGVWPAQMAEPACVHVHLWAVCQSAAYFQKDGKVQFLSSICLIIFCCWTAVNFHDVNWLTVSHLVFNFLFVK